jgi:hypothetical protein
MLFLLTPSAVANPGALRGGPPPRQALGRALVLRPRGGPRSAAFWRLLLERSLTRYVIALAPFPAAMLIWPELALPISQAPILMFGVVLYIESNVLSVPTPAKRRTLIDPDAAARGLDLLRARARAILTRVAARRGIERGVLHLVVEQSAMARVAPFTIVSVQLEGADPPVLELDAEEERLLREGLFDADLPERLLQTINLAENRFLRDLPLDARGVSAHARLAALGAREKAPGRPARAAALSARG